MCFLPNLNILLNLIINNYFNTSNCAFVISQNGGVNYGSFLPQVRIHLTQENQLIAMENILNFGCQDIIVQVDNPEAIINDFERQLMLVVQRFNDRRYLILPTGTTAELETIPAIAALSFVPDVLVVVPHVDANRTGNSLSDNCDISFKLVTHKFIGEFDNNDVVVLDYWYSQNQSFVLNSDLYPDKITDMQGRIFKMATFSYKPYSIVGSTMDGTDGTEMRVALEYASKHNATVEFVVDEINEWGEIYDNWTGNGILGNVVMDLADVGFGALYTWYHEYTYLDLSSPVVRTGITCLAPAPRLLPGWLAPFFPFNLAVWIAVIASFVISLISWAIIFHLNYNQRQREKDPEVGDINDKFNIFLMIVRVFLLQSWPTVPSLDKPPIRYILFALLILCLLIATCYNSGLASSMTVPRYEKAIQTVQDLSDSNLDWGATHEAWIFSIEAATQPVILNILNNFKIHTENQLKGHTTTRDYAFSIERLPFGHYAIGGYITEDIVPYLLLMTEDIYWEQCVMMTRKSSPFLPSLNSLILRIHETGLPYIWETQVALRYLDYPVQLEVHLLSTGHNSDSGPVKLSVTHVQGVYIIWLGGLINATIAFIAELIYYKLHSKKTTIPE